MATSSSRALPNVLITGTPGTGKTTLSADAKVPGGLEAVDLDARVERIDERIHRHANARRRADIAAGAGGIVPDQVRRRREARPAVEVEPQHPRSDFADRQAGALRRPAETPGLEIASRAVRSDERQGEAARVEQHQVLTELYAAGRQAVEFPIDGLERDVEHPVTRQGDLDRSVDIAQVRQQAAAELERGATEARAHDVAESGKRDADAPEGQVPVDRDAEPLTSNGERMLPVEKDPGGSLDPGAVRRRKHQRIESGLPVEEAEQEVELVGEVELELAEASFDGKPEVLERPLARILGSVVLLPEARPGGELQRTGRAQVGERDLESGVEKKHHVSEVETQILAERAEREGSSRAVPADRDSHRSLGRGVGLRRGVFLDPGIVSRPHSRDRRVVDEDIEPRREKQGSLSSKLRHPLRAARDPDAPLETVALDERDGAARRRVDRVVELRVETTLPDLEEGVDRWKLDAAADVALEDPGTAEVADLAEDTTDLHVSGKPEGEVLQREGIAGVDERVDEPAPGAQRVGRGNLERRLDGDGRAEDLEACRIEERVTVARQEPPGLLRLGHPRQLHGQLRNADLADTHQRLVDVHRLSPERHVDERLERTDRDTETAGSEARDRVVLEVVEHRRRLAGEILRHRGERGIHLDEVAREAEDPTRQQRLDAGENIAFRGGILRGTAYQAGLFAKLLPLSFDTLLDSLYLARVEPLEQVVHLWLLSQSAGTAGSLGSARQAVRQDIECLETIRQLVGTHRLLQGRSPEILLVLHDEPPGHGGEGHRGDSGEVFRIDPLGRVPEVQQPDEQLLETIGLEGIEALLVDNLCGAGIEAVRLEITGQGTLDEGRRDLYGRRALALEQLETYTGVVDCGGRAGRVARVAEAVEVVVTLVLVGLFAAVVAGVRNAVAVTVDPARLDVEDAGADVAPIRRSVPVVVGIAGVAQTVAVEVEVAHSLAVGEVRAEIAGVTDPVAVAIRLVAIRHPGAVVTGDDAVEVLVVALETEQGRIRGESDDRLGPTNSNPWVAGSFGRGDLRHLQLASLFQQLHQLLGKLAVLVQERLDGFVFEAPLEPVQQHAGAQRGSPSFRLAPQPLQLARQGLHRRLGLPRRARVVAVDLELDVGETRVDEGLQGVEARSQYRRLELGRLAERRRIG